MGHFMYNVFTKFQGVYILYVVPVIYFAIIVFRVIDTKRKEQQAIGVLDKMVAAAAILVAFDFANYLYLYVTGTGTLLPAKVMFVKYLFGFFLWLSILWYSYHGYFDPHVAGKYFRERLGQLGWVCAGICLSAIVGVVISL